MLSKLLAVALSVASVSAVNGPDYGGFNKIIETPFDGAGNTLPSGDNWNYITNIAVNNEWQQYTTSTRNLQQSGGRTLQIVPWNDGGRWTSGRIESKFTFTPPAGRVTFAEASIRFGGDNPNGIGNKKGIWPAFWFLGDSIRHGVGWPACGEIDAMEQVNGQLTGYGTIHCNVFPGGACNEPSGIGGSIGIPDQSWHTWRVQWDRRASSWTGETITWFRDGIQFHQVSGSRVGNQGVWNSLAASPLFMILNVAVGGDWPGPPDGNTLGGYGSMMEVGYTAVYMSN